MLKTLLQNLWVDIPETKLIIVYSNDQRMTLTYFTVRSFLETDFYMEKGESKDFLNYCSLRPETGQMQTTYEVKKGV